jgi:hypothetical protein
MPNRVNLSYFVEPELDNPAGMADVSKWDRQHITRKHPRLLVGAQEHKRLNLEYCPAGWFLFYDGARRSNQGSMSERIAPPTDQHYKWLLIAEYRNVAVNRLLAEASQLKHQLMLQTKEAQRKQNGDLPGEDDLEHLDQLVAAVKQGQRSLRKATKRAKELEPKDFRRSKDLEELDRENFEGAESVLERLEGIKIADDFVTDDDEEKAGPREIDLEGMFPSNDLTYRPDPLSPAGFTKEQRRNWPQNPYKVPPISGSDQG